jgi:glycosyltransferase involved in cell wall biosynthesis
MAGKENDYTGYLRNLVVEYNLEKHVRFAGQIDHKKIYHFIAEHHLLVMPSRFEGFGVAALEASACARPVIATNVGGIPEIIINGKTGILVPPGDEGALAEAILKLANDIGLCHKMGREGYDFAKENYRWERSLDLMSRLYEQLIHESRKN